MNTPEAPGHGDGPIPELLDVVVRYRLGDDVHELRFPGDRGDPLCSLYFDRAEMLKAREAIGEQSSNTMSWTGEWDGKEQPNVEHRVVSGKEARELGPGGVRGRPRLHLCWHSCGCDWWCLKP